MRKWIPFKRGAIAGAISLGLAFVLRIGGYGPFAPEGAIELFIKYVPASVEEAAIQQFGDAAIRLGLLGASIVAALGYGIFGIFFEDVFGPRIAFLRALSTFEKFLLYAIVPWGFFGLIYIPLTGYGFFGVTPLNGNLISPLTLLLAQLVFCAVLAWEYRQDIAILAWVAAEPAEQIATKETTSHQMSRRTFIEKGILAGGAIIFTLLSLNNLLSFLGAGGISEAIRPGQPYNLANAPAIFSDPRLAVLVDSEVTNNSNFYEVDIDLTPPEVNASQWLLDVKGTNSPKSYLIGDIQNLTQVEEYSTFECVSNTVNGNLLSTAKWTGVRISDLLKDAGGYGTGALYVVFYSVDNYSVGIPISKAIMADSILAYKMNDADLPAAHGYPLRAVIPGLYGMMSAKWITSIQVIDAQYPGYWQTRGWTKDAIVNTLAFIRVPADGAVVSLSQNNGSIILGGIAFAGDRGILKVEVSADGGNTWQPAALKQPISNLTWTLWAFDWHPNSAGAYHVYARATDGGGQTQTSTPTQPYPNGATGYAVITINVLK